MRILTLLVVFVISMGSVGASVQPVNLSAHEVVKHMTEQLFTTVDDLGGTLDTDPQLFYESIEAVLDPVVDFPWIARSVMGSHYKRLTTGQRQQFTSVFKRGLISTYAKGLVGFSAEEMKILPPENVNANAKRLSVAVEVHASTAVYPFSYTMIKNNQGEWKLLNMVMNGINLGKTFRNQFAQAVKNNDGNINAVIDQWALQR